LDSEIRGNPADACKYDVERRGTVIIDIYSVLGQRVRRLVEERKSPGSYSASWDGRDEDGIELSEGLYFYVLRFDGTSTTSQKMLMLK
jgi:flagellar hook assembly protein FlgD